MINRREFILTSAKMAGGLGLLGSTGFWTSCGSKDPIFKISLAEWSLHNDLWGGKINHLDFARIARNDFGIGAVEYVNQFFMDKGEDQDYLKEMKTIAEGEGVRNILIMCDNEGNTGDPDEAKRIQAVENHYKWVEAAKYLGCHSIRVNAFSAGSYEEQRNLVADGLRRLVEFAAPLDMNVIVENHGCLSSNIKWLVEVIKVVDHPRCGLLPDFGNFTISETESYDPYQGVAEMMPYAKGVSAKAENFDNQGNETKVDFRRLMKIVLDAGFRGYVGIEYSGGTFTWQGITYQWGELPDMDGIRATQALLERVRAELAPEYT